MVKARTLFEHCSRTAFLIPAAGLSGTGRCLCQLRIRHWRRWMTPVHPSSRCDTSCRTASVTAQQVVDGSATLSEFGLEARNRFSQGTDSRELQLYVGCVMEE